jgi:hypothetical protein
MELEDRALFLQQKRQECYPGQPSTNENLEINNDRFSIKHNNETYENHLNDVPEHKDIHPKNSSQSDE